MNLPKTEAENPPLWAAVEVVISGARRHSGHVAGVRSQIPVISQLRAVVYESNGNPASVLSVVTYPAPPKPTGSSVTVKHLLSPVNPSDINAVEGVYPHQPRARQLNVNGQERTLHIPGNEGLGEITDVGEGVKGLSKGDWVVFGKGQSGTWSSGQILEEGDVIKVDRETGISAVNAATLVVNPTTAYNMLSEFVDLRPGDWVVQNGANSAVGQAVITLAKLRGLNTINLIRKRDEFSDVEKYLKSLGATYVITYDDLEDKFISGRVKEWTGGKDIRLLLNCVGGKSTTRMLRLAGKNAHVVTYGAMAKEALSFPPSVFIFNNLTAHGFWQTEWYKQKSPQERARVTAELVKYMATGKFKEPIHEIVKIDGTLSDEEATEIVRGVMNRVASGSGGKKVLLQVDPVLS
ncbi:NAD(P)-binding protein [Thelephora ganbajun]|uniref:NAD(P)-binding protein n=1 Tax=Thelephora ganbajun TaxID=370292 RepID=A0ACB6ZK70_THEGA|nr:NAD(P)-binding protein [Thelephora ganbajun]